MKRVGPANGARKSGLLTPLVDVICGLAVAVFAFLIIYMLLVVPKRTRKLHFLTRKMPAAAPYAPYFSNVPVAGGSGEFTFLMLVNPRSRLLRLHKTRRIVLPKGSGPEDGDTFVDELLRQNVCLLHLNGRNGLLDGVFWKGALGKGDRARDFRCRFVVVDNREAISVPKRKAEKWGDVWLHFYEEHRKGKGGAREVGTAGAGAHEGAPVRCLVAIRADLTLPVKPHKIPFDPEKHPLEVESPPPIRTHTGRAVRRAITVRGGLEPYEFLVAGDARWLRYDGEKGLLSGTPAKPGLYNVIMEVKDAQTPKGDWDTARKIGKGLGKPYARVAVSIEVKSFAPLTAELSLPPFGRVGESLAGGVAARGGIGDYRFKPLKVPPGLKLDAETGHISGKPTKAGGFDIEAEVRDEGGAKVLVRSKKPLLIVAPRPDPGIVHSGSVPHEK